MSETTSGISDKDARKRDGIVTRFAPSPTGYLHLGHAYSALINTHQASASDGRFLLRIEDIDQTRCRPDFDAAIFEDLTWLGVTWETPVMRQSERLALYQSHLDTLQAKGLVYRCFRSRKDIEDILRAPHASDANEDLKVFTGAPLAAGEERDNLADGRPFAWRLSLSAAQEMLGPDYATLNFAEEVDGVLKEVPADPGRFGDVVLGRKDSGTSYHLSSVIDDAAQGVTHVTRGEDLREAAGLHTLLQVLLGLPRPVYRHHDLITNAAGERLSKRDGAMALRSLRESGKSAADVRALMPAL